MSQIEMRRLLKLKPRQQCAVNSEKFGILNLLRYDTANIPFHHEIIIGTYEMNVTIVTTQIHWQKWIRHIECASLCVGLYSIELNAIGERIRWDYSEC